MRPWVCNKNPYRKENGSFIDREELLKVAEEMHYRKVMKVEQIAVMLGHGANIGVEGEGR